MTETSLTPQVRSKPILKQELAFLFIHLLPLAALWTGARGNELVLLLHGEATRDFFSRLPGGIGLRRDDKKE